MFENLREDLRRYGEGSRQQTRALLLVPGMWAIAGYRFARWAHTAELSRPVRRLMNVIATLSNVFVQVATNIEIPASALIGPGLYIAHTGYIVLASGVVMGSHCTMTQGVTIGHGGGGGGGDQEYPVIGDRVYLGPGSAVIGPLKIGDDALIGVSAVVTRSVPPRGVAIGNPARVISLKGSFEVISYTGMETDPQRLNALREMTEEDARLVVD